jgi:hypothetical protein
MSDTDTQPEAVTDDGQNGDGESQTLEQVRAALKRASRRNKELENDFALSQSLRQDAEETRDRAVSAAEAERDRAIEAERTVRAELAFTKAGIDLDSGAGQSFRRAYEGDPLDPEAVADAWALFQYDVLRSAGVPLPTPDQETT